jgi:hypothetical protein
LRGEYDVSGFLGPSEFLDETVESELLPTGSLLDDLLLDNLLLADLLLTDRVPSVSPFALITAICGAKLEMEKAAVQKKTASKTAMYFMALLLIFMCLSNIS